MGSPDRTLEDRPEAFEGVHMGIAPRVFLLSVVNRLMVVPKPGQDAVRPPFVRADGRTGGDVLEDRRNEGLAAGVGDNLREQFAAPLKDTHDDSLVRPAPGNAFLLSALPNTTDIGFVHFDMARQRRITVNGSHVFPDLVRHAKCGWVGHAQLPLQFLGRNAMPGSGEQIHRIEPFLKGCMRTVKHGPDHRVNLISAPSALIGRVTADAVKLPALAALRAIQPFAVTKLHEVVQTSVVIWELFHKLLDSRGLCHVSLRC